MPASPLNGLSLKLSERHYENFVLAARALRAFADGFVAVLLPAYLLALGHGQLAQRKKDESSRRVHHLRPPSNA